MSATIGGSLPFQGPPSATSYTQQYQVALAQNQANYNNILSGYQSTQQAQEAAQQGIQQGYATLSANVLNTIQGISASQQQQINDVYAQNSGAAAQSLISRGLGNTTVANSVQRGMLSDQQKASINLANQTAGLTAGYQSNLGLAGLNYANQANMQNTGLKQSQLGYMASQQMPYPNALGYAQLQRQNLPMGGGGGSYRSPGNFGAMPADNYNPGGGGGGTYDQITPSQYGYQMRPTTGGGGGGQQSFSVGNQGYESTSSNYPGYAQQDQSGGGNYAGGSSGSNYAQNYTQPGGDAMYPAQDYGGSGSYYSRNYTQGGSDAMYPAQEYGGSGSGSYAQNYTQPGSDAMYPAQDYGGQSTGSGYYGEESTGSGYYGEEGGEYNDYTGSGYY